MEFHTLSTRRIHFEFTGTGSKFNFQKYILQENSAEPNQTKHFLASGLALNCLSDKAKMGFSQVI